MTQQEISQLKVKCLEIAIAAGSTNIEETAKRLFEWIATSS